MSKLGIVETPSTHHHRGFLVVDGVRVLSVYRSRGDGPMPTSVAHLFRKSLKLSVAEFERLLGCTLSREMYVERLRELGHLTHPGESP